MYIKYIFVSVLIILMTSCSGNNAIDAKKEEIKQKTASDFVVGEGGNVGGGFGNPVNSGRGVDIESGRK